MQKGKASIKFDKEPVIMGAASIVGEKEGEGPLKSCFDRVEPDPMYGQDSWEAAESEFQRQTALKCLEKSGLKESDICLQEIFWDRSWLLLSACRIWRYRCSVCTVPAQPWERQSCWLP